MIRILLGLAFSAIALGIYSLAIATFIVWWTLCFGTVVFGVLLLVFAPNILLLPAMLLVPGHGCLALAWRQFTGGPDASGAVETTQMILADQQGG